MKPFIYKDLALLPAIPDVHIYRYWLQDASPQFTDWLTTLSQPEQIRASRFIFMHDKWRFIQARYLLRLICAHYLNKKPDEIQFIYGPHDKPALIHNEVSFNLSHSGNCALFIFTEKNKVGIDVEVMDRPHQIRQIAKRFFAKEELALIQPLKGQAYIDAFYTVWTRKEAFIKATGLGLAHPLPAFSVNIADEASFLSGVDPHWFIAALDVGKGYKAAYVVENGLRL